MIENSEMKTIYIDEIRHSTCRGCGNLTDERKLWWLDEGNFAWYCEKCSVEKGYHLVEERMVL
jgi:hypothetical protein